MLEVDKGTPAGAPTEFKFADVASRAIIAQKMERTLQDRGVKIKKYKKKNSNVTAAPVQVPPPVDTSTYVNPAFQSLLQQQHAASQHASSPQQQYFHHQSQQAYQQQPTQPPNNAYQNGQGQYSQPAHQNFFPALPQPLPQDTIQPLTRAFTYAHHHSNSNYSWGPQPTRGMDALIMDDSIPFNQVANNPQEDMGFLTLHRRTMSMPCEPSPTLDFRNPITDPFLPLEWCIICQRSPPNARFTNCGHGYCVSCDTDDRTPDDTKYCDGCVRSLRNVCLICKKAPPSPAAIFKDCKHGYCEQCDTGLPNPEDFRNCDFCRVRV